MKKAGWLVLMVLAGGAGVPTAFYSAEDTAACDRVFRVASERGWARMPIDRVIVAVGSHFIGLPYKAHSLERPGEESLTVDFTGMDCTTFVENTLALARCIRRHQPTFDAYMNELRAIRYRNGEVSGYPARLHYFSDWIDEGMRKSRLADVTGAAGGLPYPLSLSFMTAHPQAYPPLRRTEVFQAMRRCEQAASGRKHHYWPKDTLGQAIGHVRAGDIIAITTSVPGLDISHVGLAAPGADGALHFLNAPMAGRRVELTRDTLVKHLSGPGSHTGIMVARPLEPVPVGPAAGGS